MPLRIKDDRPLQKLKSASLQVQASHGTHLDMCAELLHLLGDVPLALLLLYVPPERLHGVIGGEVPTAHGAGSVTDVQHANNNLAEHERAHYLPGSRRMTNIRMVDFQLDGISVAMRPGAAKSRRSDGEVSKNLSHP